MTSRHIKLNDIGDEHVGEERRKWAEIVVICTGYCVSTLIGGGDNALWMVDIGSTVEGSRREWAASEIEKRILEI